MREIGTLYTIGYADIEAAAQVERLMNQEHMLLVDIRLSPRSRWRPAWNRNALRSVYSERYAWEPRLGNLHYQDRTLAIKLAEGHMDAIHELAKLLREGASIILLCACKDARTCHRTFVAKLIQDAVQKLQEKAVQA